MASNRWTRNELIIAFNLYCKTPFGKIHIHNPEIIALAKTLGRTPSAVSWKLANFASLDPSLKDRNIAGASHGSKMDLEVWNEFNGNWEQLAFESERLLAQKLGKPLEGVSDIQIVDLPKTGQERDAVIRVRVNQGFFRKAVLAAYSYKCCITGLELPELLNASHIIPWSVDENNRVNPRNGFCLNAIHDRAFDRGIITVTTDFLVKVSVDIKRENASSAVQDLLLKYEGKKINLPERFVPDINFLKYHNEVIFRG